MKDMHTNDYFTIHNEREREMKHVDSISIMKIARTINKTIITM